MPPSVPVMIQIYLAAYAAIALGLFFYGMHAYLVCLLSRRLRHRAQPARAGAGTELPQVTVQLPVYNELYVVDRLIEAACALDYPRELLEIQVLDDSTDETTTRIAELCRLHRRRGIDITHLRRADRRGFKGGALRAGLERARGELLAIFDADFVPPRDFLTRAVPHFVDPEVGMVQARWGHLNESYSALTRAQAMALDGHFMIEQTVRNRAGAFMNFNGTAGLWRRRCILDAGNWQDDTLTEDLDLSYRAQLRGWRFVFLPELVCPAELPAEVNAFKGQQYRWAKGSMQTARKQLPRILRTPLPLFTKFQATVHLTNHLVYPLLLALALSSLPSLWVLERYPETRSFFRVLTVLVIASFGHPLLYGLSQKAMGRDWRRRLAIIPMVIAGGMGIAINNTRAVIEALLGRQSPFVRTPKYRLVTRSDHWRGRRYRAPRSPLAYVEMGFAVYMAITIVYALKTGSILIVPFLCLYLLGFLYTGGFSILHDLRRPETHRGSSGLIAAWRSLRTPSPTRTTAGGRYSQARATPPV